MITVTRYHDISAGHRVAGHESKCSQLHGHNYRIHFTCEVEDLEEFTALDTLGRVIDFGVIKSTLCEWLERNWDHKFLAWGEDVHMRTIEEVINGLALSTDEDMYHPVISMFCSSILWVPFNPTAENMAQYLVEQVGPRQLEGTGVVLTKVKIDETRKCSATYRIKR